MSTITTINSTDLITNSRADINNNFANLNNDKIETSVIDTDTTLAANSDTKIPSQKAVKAYVDAGGNVNASTTTKGIVELATQAEVDAGTATGGTGAALVVTPDTLGNALGNKRSITAGETINGSTTPVPVYQNKTDFEFYACDANDTGKLKFLGFGITNGTDGNSMTVQFSGIVTGFTGLTRGEKYYVQDTTGTIGTSIGTYEVLVGVAISTTELLIQKGQRRAAGSADISATTASGSNAITCGFRPSKIRIHAALFDSTNYSTMSAIWVNGSMTGYGLNGGLPNVTTSARFYDGGGTSYLDFTITSVTDTGFTITYTETGTFSVTVAAYSWEAEGEL